MNSSASQRFSFRGFVALADILFALSASLLLLNPPTLSATSGDKSGLLEETSLGKLDPVAIMLVKNRVVPLNSEYFVVRPEGQRQMISRVKDGEPVTEALKHGGLLANIITSTDPKKQYLIVLVCADSIRAFRSVVEALTDRGLAFSWITWNDDPWPLSSGGPNDDPLGYRPPIK